MKVLFVSSEAVPFAKTGGLADMSGSLPNALKEAGCDVTLVIPRYRVVDENKYGLKSTGISVTVPISDKVVKGEILKAETWSGLRVCFVGNDNYYDREHLYGTADRDYPDNAERFVFFSRAVIEMCRALDFRPDVVHCNDWQTALVPVYLKTLYKEDELFSRTATVYTVHNLAYQGLFWHFDLHLTGLGWDIFNPEGIEFYGKMNLMKGGLLFSDVITTVSKAYSMEIQTKEFGCGLEGVLARRKKDLYGIINGIDYREWDPECDHEIAANYTVKNPGGKSACKEALLDCFSLPRGREVPLIAMISRLVDQKGLDLITESLDRLMGLDMQFVCLGTGEKKYEKKLKEIAKRFPDKAGVKIGYDSALSHKIEAGADIFLMPSRFEPCGLNQMYSLRYGTIPIVRGIGGLDDTVTEFDEESGTGNGFKFREYSADAMLDEIKKALGIYRRKRSWNMLMNNAMACDCSIGHTAEEYIKIYKKAGNKIRREMGR